MAFRVTDAYVLVRACTIGNRAVACWGVRTCELFLCFTLLVRFTGSSTETEPKIGPKSLGHGPQDICKVKESNCSN